LFNLRTKEQHQRGPLQPGEAVGIQPLGFLGKLLHSLHNMLTTHLLPPNPWLLQADEEERL
jgi:hypothetical protein